MTLIQSAKQKKLGLAEINFVPKENDEGS